MLIKWSGIAVVDGRNKVGGSVFGTGKGGAFVRNKVTPINRRSASQSQSRGLFAHYSSVWRTLTDTQRAGFNDLATQATYNNIFGDSKTLTGKSLFQKLNINLFLIGSADVMDAPAFIGANGALGFLPVADVSATGMFVGATFAGLTAVVPTGNTMLISATPMLSAGITAPKQNRFRVISTIAAGDDTTTQNIWSAYVDVFGAPAVGANVWLQISCINNATGFASTKIVGACPINA